LAQFGLSSIARRDFARRRLGVSHGGIEPELGKPEIEKDGEPSFAMIEL